MKVMLLKDVYKLGRAGDVKRVADGYGRNYLIPQGLAVLATPGVLKQVDRIREKATQERARLNLELSAVSERLSGLELIFPAKAGETGRLYGSVTTAMIAEEIERATGVKVSRRQIDSQPLKMLGVHWVNVQLTIDLTPEVKVVIHREGEPPESAYAIEGIEIVEAEAIEDFAELKAELEIEEEEMRAQEEQAEVAVDEQAIFEDQEAEESGQEPIEED